LITVDRAARNLWRRLAWASAAILLAIPTATRGATEIGPMRLGVPGLSSTIVAPQGPGSPLRLGLAFEHSVLDPTHGIDVQGFGPSITSELIRFQLLMRAADAVEISATMPYRLVRVEGEPSITGLGDLEAAVTGRIFRVGRLTVGAWGSIRLPTGNDAKGLSTKQVEGDYGLHSTVVFFEDSVLPQMKWHSNVGYRSNKNEDEGYGLVVDASDVATTGVFPPAYPAVPTNERPNYNDEILLRTAVEFQRRWAHLFLEASVDWLVNDKEASFQESASWITPGVYLGGDEGPGLKATWSIGLFADDAKTPFVPPFPDWVAQVGVSYPVFFGGRDRDRDGVPDSEDACPQEPEDIDGFQDQDGCPDLDNDQDGIADRVDAAPNLPEDFDGFEDEDGRPDLDNDLDGIPDAVDQCPMQPEDYDGFEDQDGCPDVFLDADGDGIEDAQDNCPQEAEDIDGFEDEDGCPDLDNDLDGIPDVRDQCPDQREDYDGDRDDDGCPDP
jgi:hypothetical protein